MEFTLTEEFRATPEQLYKTWLSSAGHTKMTGSTANISDVAGDKFTAWDGYISGTNLELIPFTKIKQSWRTTDFADKQKDSIVEITLKEVKPGNTLLTLVHSKLSGSDDKQYIDGWKDFYFKPMKKFIHRP